MNQRLADLRDDGSASVRRDRTPVAIEARDRRGRGKERFDRVQQRANSCAGERRTDEYRNDLVVRTVFAEIAPDFILCRLDALQ